MVATADDMASGGSMANTMIFSTTPKEADAMTPIWFTMMVMIRNEMFTKASCNAMGAPNTSTRLDSVPFSRMSRRVNSK